MSITFLIGNGFDLNLGLKTCYTDFYDVYLNDTNGDSSEITALKKIIEEDKTTHSCNTWACAELAFGAYTEKFEVGQAEEFCNCHEDFCEKLANYLEKEQEKINFTAIKKHIQLAFTTPHTKILENWTTEEQQEISKVLSSINNEFVFNYVNFNYTSALDKCIAILKKSENVLGSRRVHNQDKKNRVGQLLHVHGNTQRNMVLGVDNETQIANAQIFDDEPIYLSQIIKNKTNSANREFYQENTIKILDSSKIICIYGMSIGATDSMWWEKICSLLKTKREIILIIYTYNFPDIGLVNTKRTLEVDKVRNMFLAHSDFDKKIKDELKSRVYINSYNLFSELENIVIHEDNKIISTNTDNKD